MAGCAWRQLSFYPRSPSQVLRGGARGGVLIAIFITGAFQASILRHSSRILISGLPGWPAWRGFQRVFSWRRQICLQFCRQICLPLKVSASIAQKGEDYGTIDYETMDKSLLSYSPSSIVFWFSMNSPALGECIISNFRKSAGTIFGHLQDFKESENRWWTLMELLAGISVD
jgi:hypothetical protein